jgi:hypothetical protein
LAAQNFILRQPKTTLIKIFLFCLISQLAIAQTPLTYINGNGDRNPAGFFDLEALRTDTTFSQWYESNYSRFQLKGEDTSWKSAFEQTEVEIYIGT